MRLRAAHAACGQLLGLACLAGGLWAVAACGGRAPAAPRGDGGAAPATSAGPAAAADPVRILSLPHDEVWRRLGPHRYQAKSRLRVTVADQPADVLDEEYQLEAGTAGAFHALYHNAHDQGREVVLVAGDLFVRPRYGTFVRRRPEAGEADRLRAEAFGGLAAAVEVVGRFVQARPAGPATVAGRPARRLALSLAAQPRPAAPAPDPRREWRASVVVQRLTGSLDVDESTGAPLAVTLKAGYTFRRGGASATAELELEASLTAGVQVAVTAPAHVPLPTRTRYHVERRELLKGLVPPGAGQP
jgi:hypothetical protein